RPRRQTPGRASPAWRERGPWPAAPRARWERRDRRPGAQPRRPCWRSRAPERARRAAASLGRLLRLDAHRPRQRAPDRVLALTEAHEPGPAERLAVDNLETVAQRDA